MGRRDIEKVLRYLAGESDPAEAADTRRLIEDDPEAAGVAAWFRRLETILRGDDSVEPPEAAVLASAAIFDPARLPHRPTWIERFDAVIAALVADGRQSLAGLRRAGPQERFNLLYQAGDSEIDLQASRLASEPDRDTARWRLVGTVETSPGPLVAVAVVAPGSDHVLERTTADDDGRFVVDVPAGRYDLLLRVDRETVVLADLHLP